MLPEAIEHFPQSSSSSDFWLTCRYRGHIHNSGPPSRQLACCTHGRSHTRSPGVSIMRVDSWELPLSAIPLCQLLPSHLGPPRPTLSINLYIKGCLDCTIGAFHMSIPAEPFLFQYEVQVFNSEPEPQGQCYQWEVRRKIQAVIGVYDELTLVKKQKLRWFGHISRSSGLAKTVQRGTVKGKRRRGRQKKRWEDNIKELTGIIMDFASSRPAENRTRWKGIVANSSVVPQWSYKVMG